MLTRYIILIGIASVMTTVIGCSGSAPVAEQGLLERNWGRSFETIHYMQIANPQAAKNIDPVLGLDGKASEHNTNKYQESFKGQQQEQSETVLKLK
jgi:hypothetical protein